MVKYESLNAELSEIFDQLGVPFDGTLGVRAKSQYRKDRTPYRDVFSTTQRDIISAAFQTEIDMHGYTF